MPAFALGWLSTLAFCSAARVDAQRIGRQH